MQIDPSKIRGFLISIAGRYSLSKLEKLGTVLLFGFLFCVVPAWLVGGIYLEAVYDENDLIAFLRHPSALGISFCAAIPGVIFILNHISSIWTISADGIEMKSMFPLFSWCIQAELITAIFIEHVRLQRVIMINPRMGKKRIIPASNSMEIPSKRWMGY